jgi:hypothetical protein
VYIYFSIMLKENSVTYRNTNDFITTHQETIDAGSLWELKGAKLVLVDDDNFVETNLDLVLFEKVK